MVLMRVGADIHRYFKPTQRRKRRAISNKKGVKELHYPQTPLPLCRHYNAKIYFVNPFLKIFLFSCVIPLIYGG